MPRRGSGRGRRIASSRVRAAGRRNIRKAQLSRVGVRGTKHRSRNRPKYA